MINFLSNLSATFTGLFLTLISHQHTPYTECGSHQNINYCYYAGAPTTTRTVYFLHGFGNNTEAWSWNSVTERIEREWKAANVAHPNVVTISFGNLWWYNSERGKEMAEFVTWLEQLKKIPPTTDRALYGDSMGGHNSFRWAADFPQLFHKLALICPAFPTSYAAKVSETGPGNWPANYVADVVIRHHYTSTLPDVLNPLRNPPYWEKLKTLTNVHIIVSKTDFFGFYSGGLELHQEFQKHPSIKLSLEEQVIRHCDADAKELAPFLAL